MKKLLIRLLERLTGIKVTGPHERALREIQVQNLEIATLRASEDTRCDRSIPVEKAERMAKEMGMLLLQNGAIEISAHENAVEMKLRFIKPKEQVDYKTVLNNQ